MKELYHKIQFLSGKNYGLYKQLLGKSYPFGDFSLEFLHIQGDPYAPPSKILAVIPMSVLGFESSFWNTLTKKIALSDFLHRELFACLQEKYGEKNEEIICACPEEAIFIRNSVWIDNGFLQILFSVPLPGKDRKIDGDKAKEILTFSLPDVLTNALYATKEKREEARKAIFNLEVRAALLEKLKENDLVAFIPNGAILARENGLSEKPLKNAIPFLSPPEMEVELEVCGQKIKGMGIKKGITVITGGAFHGKSTLLDALKKAVYPHIEGDGREWIVIDESALYITKEEGRSVRHSDISALVRSLPGGKTAKDFSTANASGSTSEAANLMEAIEFGTTTFLIDEDSSAVNFLVRDALVRQLLDESEEPLVPLIDKISDFKKAGLSFILVAGACGKYLEIADDVLVLKHFKVFNETKKVKSLIEKNDSFKQGSFEKPQCRAFAPFIQELKSSVKPLTAVEKNVKVKVQGTKLQIGFLTAETANVFQFKNQALLFGAGYILLNILQNPEEKLTNTLLQEKFSKIENVGFRAFAKSMTKDTVLPRSIEIFQVLLRLRDYKKGE